MALKELRAETFADHLVRELQLWGGVDDILGKLTDEIQLFVEAKGDAETIENIRRRRDAMRRSSANLLKRFAENSDMRLTVGTTMRTMTKVGWLDSVPSRVRPLELDPLMLVSANGINSGLSGTGIVQGGKPCGAKQ